MRAIGNFLWFIFGAGFWLWLLWLILSVLSFVSIVGIPWGRACWNISELAFGPFGREAIDRKELTQTEDIGTSFFGLLGNLIWFICIGWWVALLHVGAGVLCCISLIGIPFGIQHFKLAGLALYPIGKTIVPKELAENARSENARLNLESVRAGRSISKGSTASMLD